MISVFSDIPSDTVEHTLFAKCVVYSCLAILLGFLYRRWVNGEQFDKKTNSVGKVAIVTGGNTGIGKETALGLAQHGLEVILACRDMKKAEKARDYIVKESGNDKIKCMQLDLASFKSIRSFANEFLATGLPLHVLVNNAGVLAVEKSLTEDGLEMTIGVNHFGHFLLTMLLLRRLYESKPSRIINVSSYAHKVASINRDDLMGTQSYNRFYAYAQSKLANIYFTIALAKRIELSGVVCNALHPGAVRSDLSRNLIKFNSLFQKYNNRILKSQFMHKTYKWLLFFLFFADGFVIFFQTFSSVQPNLEHKRHCMLHLISMYKQ